VPNRRHPSEQFVQHRVHRRHNGQHGVANKSSRRGHTAGGWSPTVADSQFWGELVAATGEFSCPSVGRNLAATGEDLMSADRTTYATTRVGVPPKFAVCSVTYRRYLPRGIAVCSTEGK
jgi:hypothetical protein